MEIQFKECDWFDLWIWLTFPDVPSEAEKQLLDEVFTSWFLLGKLGGFNAVNMQVQETGVDISHFDYDPDAEGDMMSVMHNMTDLEYDGYRARCWVDLGTADAIALDVLINSLRQFNHEYMVIEQLVIGGKDPDWPIEESQDFNEFRSV